MFFAFMASPPSDHSTPPAAGAVFLSYAREDTDAARRIAEALRSHGLEVWFDQNELRGGDAWDQKIRQQIADCALFLPLVSQHTQARSKGYFRLEWKLAVEQTHLMLEGVPYLAPIAIDDTPESGAAVPAEFMKVQWTRLPGALPTPPFVAQIKRLLDAPAKPTSSARPAPVHSSSSTASTSAPRSSGIPVWLAAVVGIALLAGIAFFALRTATKETPVSASAKPVAETKAAAPSPAVSNPAPAPVASPIDAKSIAVLPFVNMSGDKDSEYFSDGLTEEILNALARNPALRVAARTSSFAFKGKATAMDEIGRALHAASVIEGSVRKDGSRVRITIQLINAADGYHVWSETFTREMTDIFALQDEIANKVAEKLGGAAILAAPAATVVPTKNLAAYDSYLRARAAENRGASELSVEIMKLYEQTLRLDPDYALAWARLANVCADIYGRGLNASNEIAVKARSAASAALRLDPNLPDVHLASARIAQDLDHDFESTRRELDLVERLRPNEPELPAARVRLADASGQWGASLSALVARAVDADPQNAKILISMTGILISNGSWAEADRLCDRALAAGAAADVVIRSKVINLVTWTGDAAAALALLETTPEAARATSRFYYQRADLRLKLEDFTGAIADYERYRVAVKQNYPNLSGPRGVALSALLNTGVIEARRGNEARSAQIFAEASAEIDVLQKDFPESLAASTVQANILARRGQAAEALATVNQAKRRALASQDVPSIMAQHRSVAGILAILGRADDALAELRIVHESGYAFGYSLRTNVDLRSLHGDVRFQKLMAECEARADAQPRPKK